MILIPINKKTKNYTSNYYVLVILLTGVFFL